VALKTTLQPIAASAFAVVHHLPKADTPNTSYDTCVGIVNLNGFVQPVRFYPRDAMLARVFAIATCPSVRPPVLCENGAF